jgi:hypothetical protein
LRFASTDAVDPPVAPLPSKETVYFVFAGTERVFVPEAEPPHLVPEDLLAVTFIFISTAAEVRS